MTELQSGALLGRYELLVRIGRGGMASVWVARERSAVSGKERLVAVKAMLPELAAHSEFRSMFLGEVQITQSIHHDNVVRVFEVSEDRGMLYMAMEWVEGDSLRNLIRAARSRSALPPEIAVRIAADAAAGLHAAHELRDWDGELRGIVHCDVSPHNILVGVDGKAKLVDFGIANALGRLEPQGDGEKIKGKLSYMSPEQTLGQKLDRRSDVFALGIVLFEMTTGEQLFKGRDAAHTLELVRSGAIPLPSQLNPRYPKRLEAITMRALDRDPARRFQTAEEFEQMLTNYLYEERILVSHAAVAQLLMRVIGPRIERRREVIARVVQAVENHPRTDEASSHPLSALAELSSPMHSDPFNYTLTNAGDEETALGVAARLESQTILAQSIAVPQREEPIFVEPDPRSKRWIWIAAIAMILLLGAIAAYDQLREPSSLVGALAQQTSASVPTSTPPPSVPASPVVSASSGDHGQSAESLPVADDSKPREIPTSGRRIGGHRTSVGARDAVRPASVDLDDPTAARKTPSATNAESQSNSAPNTPADGAGKKPAATEEGINRAAANAALASAAAAAVSCRNQGDAPTGQGRAAVTFAPDGSAVAVSLSQRFTGTPVGNCVAAQFRQAHAPAFSGDAVTLFYPFQIPQ
jgi:eukaryotic-like serine/threonine-protein kinase